MQHEDRFLIGDRLVLAQQVSLEAYHDALGGARRKRSRRRSSLTNPRSVEDTLVAILNEFTDTDTRRVRRKSSAPASMKTMRHRRAVS